MSTVFSVPIEGGTELVSMVDIYKPEVGGGEKYLAQLIFHETTNPGAKYVPSPLV